MGAQTDRGPTTSQDTLAPYFDDSVAVVRRAFARLEEGYILPAVDLFKALFSAHPIPFVFFTIFLSFSFFPFLAYIIISFATLSVALTLALCIAFLFSAGVFVFLGKFTPLRLSCRHVLNVQSGGILLSILCLTLLLSGFLTCFAMSTYLAARLMSNLRHSGRSGFRAWYQEVTIMLSPSSPYLAPADEDLYDSKGMTGGEVKDSHGIDTEPAEPVTHE
ncbi:hypothetical protein EI94DRAFT_1828158 [Lactarius quietus]|nr:hypothetical protein EI94DRAFT_1828158 [Lactarius quietus]